MLTAGEAPLKKREKRDKRPIYHFNMCTLHIHILVQLSVKKKEENQVLNWIIIHDLLVDGTVIQTGLELLLF